MMPTAKEIELRVRKASEHPNLIHKDDLWVLCGALLLCLREDDNGISVEYAKLTNGRDVQQDVAESLANLPVDEHNPTLEPLLTTFERDPQFYEAMHAALVMTFPKTNGAAIKLNAITPIQLLVLTRLASADAIWRCDMSLRDRLLERGLPTTSHELNRLVVLLQ